VKLLEEPALKAIGEKHGKTPAQVLIRWQLQRGVAVIPKSVTPARIKKNFAVFDFNLSEEEMSDIGKFECGGRLILPLVAGKPRDGAHPHFPFHIPF